MVSASRPAIPLAVVQAVRAAVSTHLAVGTPVHPATAAAIASEAGATALVEAGIALAAEDTAPVAVDIQAVEVTRAAGIITRGMARFITNRFHPGVEKG